jgi:hypothetical protein
MSFRYRTVLQLTCLVGAAGLSFTAGAWSLGAAQQSGAHIPRISAKPADLKNLRKFDPLKFISNEPGMPPGVVAYVANIPYDNQPAGGWSKFFLIIRTLGVSKPGGSYAVEITPPTADSVYDPRFSPNGKYLAVNVGTQYDTGATHVIWIWDVEAHQYIPGPKVLVTYSRVSWSPDSRYFTYIRGGAVDGTEQIMLDGGDPKNFPWVSLWVYDMKTRQSTFIVQDTHATQAAWDSKGNLLFTSTPTAVRHRQSRKRAEFGPTDEAPNIYRFAMGDVRPRLYIQNAYGPLPAPTGSWIAFYSWLERTAGSAQNAKSKHRIHRTANAWPEGGVLPGSELGLFLQRGGASATRVQVAPLQRAGSLARTAQWTQDARHLIYLKQTYSKTGLGEAAVCVATPGSASSKVVATVKGQDYQSTPVNFFSVDPQFRLYGVSRSGKWVCVRSRTILSKLSGTYELKRQFTLTAVNMATGVQVPLAELIDEYSSMTGIDWRFADEN